MALSDPQTITISGSAKTLSRIAHDVRNTVISTTYANADETVKLTITHKVTQAGRIRSEVRWDFAKVAADPISAVNKQVVLTDYRVIDRPNFGFTEADVLAYNAGIETWTDDTVLGKLYGKQS